MNRNGNSILVLALSMALAEGAMAQDKPTTPASAVLLDVTVTPYKVSTKSVPFHTTMRCGSGDITPVTTL